MQARSREAALKHIGLALLVASLAPAPSAQALDRALYARLLSAHTREVADAAGVRVDYAALRSSADWRALVASLAATDPARLSARAERLAFWIDAYNILAMDWIVRSEPVASIRELGSPLWPVWKREAGRIGGRAYTLDEIEHGILRKLSEPRIHAAIVCASTSCPSLAREPYRPETLDAQLDAALRRFLADPRKGSRLDAERGELVLSPIFDWFAEDFAAAGGALAFVRPHLPGTTRAWLAAHEGRVRIETFDYDWSLNGLAR
jgi:hypothetical protein